MALAKDVMTRNPLMIGSGMDIMEAIDFINSHSITSAPVVTPLGDVIGQLTEMELVVALVHYKAQDSKTKKIIHIQHMLGDVVFVNEDEHVAVVLRSMMKAPSHRVLVKHKNEKIVGIISPKDILHSINGEKGEVSQTLMDEIRSLHEEVGELKEKLADMSDYLDVYESIFQSGLYMLHSSDKEGKILLANEEMHDALGYEQGELIGKSIFDIYPPTVHADVRVGLKKVLAEGKHHIIFSSMRKKGGQVIRVEITSAALKDNKGRNVGTFTISREIDSEALLKSLHGIIERYGDI